jgi:hypothetical protein
LYALKRRQYAVGRWYVGQKKELELNTTSSIVMNSAMRSGRGRGIGLSKRLDLSYIVFERCEFDEGRNQCVDVKRHIQPVMDASVLFNHPCDTINLMRQELDGDRGDRRGKAAHCVVRDPGSFQWTVHIGDVARLSENLRVGAVVLFFSLVGTGFRFFILDSSLLKGSSCGDFCSRADGSCRKSMEGSVVRESARDILIVVVSHDACREAARFPLQLLMKVLALRL